MQTQTFHFLIIADNALLLRFGIGQEGQKYIFEVMITWFFIILLHPHPQNFLNHLTGVNNQPNGKREPGRSGSAAAVISRLFVSPGKPAASENFVTKYISSCRREDIETVSSIGSRPERPTIG